jgi:hypothetical protein
MVEGQFAKRETVLESTPGPWGGLPGARPQAITSLEMAPCSSPIPPPGRFRDRGWLFAPASVAGYWWTTPSSTLVEAHHILAAGDHAHLVQRGDARIFRSGADHQCRCLEGLTQMQARLIASMKAT